MDVSLVEDDSIKQFSADSRRMNITDPKNIAELRIESDGHPMLASIPADDFLTWHEFLEDTLNNKKADVVASLGVSHRTSLDEECDFCGGATSVGFYIPATLDVGPEGEVYPALAGGNPQGLLCSSCAKAVKEEIETIMEERQDIILAHEL